MFSNRQCEMAATPPVATFAMFTMIGDGMVAAVVILVSVLLLGVALLCLRFSFLTAAEQDLYSDLVTDALGKRVRLEQERIDWAWVVHRIQH